MEREETLTFPWQILERHIYDAYCYVISKMALLLLCIDFLSITMQYALMRYRDCNIWNKDFHFLCWSILRYLSLSFLTETHFYPQLWFGLSSLYLRIPLPGKLILVVSDGEADGIVLRTRAELACWNMDHWDLLFQGPEWKLYLQLLYKTQQHTWQINFTFSCKIT